MNGDDIVEIVFSGGNPNFNRGITTVCETPSGGFSCGGADPSVGVGRGDVKFLDVNNDNWKEAFISGQTDNEGEATFQLRYGSDNFEFAGPIQEFTDEQGDIISFTFSSLDVVQDDGVLKILVSGNRCFPEICPEAFLFTQVDCNDSLWYDDTDGDGFGDNYSVSMCSRST